MDTDEGGPIETDKTYVLVIAAEGWDTPRYFTLHNACYLMC